MFIKFKLTAAILTIILLMTNFVFAAEEILSYDVDLIVKEDGVLSVTEKIVVRAEHHEIKRGIYRDFPTDYKTTHGNRMRVGFDVKKVLRDGKPEEYFTKTRSNGVRVYIGNKDRYVSQGVHEYSISYETTRQLGFFDNHDELYFNAIPHGFVFPIKKGSVTVYLPESVPKSSLRLTGYTGSQGSKAQNFVSWVTEGAAYFDLTAPLGSRQGFTIVVEFPKGIVEEPTQLDYWYWFLRDNLYILLGFIGVMLLLSYYLHVWNELGRDPQKSTVIPRWEPPENFSPADIAYVQSRKCDSKVIAACVVESAVKGWIEVEEVGKNKYLNKTYGEEPLSEEALAFSSSLFSEVNRVELDKSNHVKIRKAIEATETSLKQEHLKKSFVLNREAFLQCIGLTVVIFLVMAAISFYESGAPFGPSFFFFGPALLVINLAFRKLLEAPTVVGQRNNAAIEGFKMYLDTAEAETFKRLGAPNDSLEVFEKFLPYAVALGVDYQWGKRFESIIEEAIAAGKVDQSRRGLYRDSYQNNFFSSNGISGGLSSAIASSSVAPGSSSGGGGGGFSGGGGGGGGGGGW